MSRKELTMYSNPVKFVCGRALPPYSSKNCMICLHTQEEYDDYFRQIKELDMKRGDSVVFLATCFNETGELPSPGAQELLNGLKELLEGQGLDFPYFYGPRFKRDVKPLKTINDGKGRPILAFVENQQLTNANHELFEESQELLSEEESALFPRCIFGFPPYSAELQRILAKTLMIFDK